MLHPTELIILLDRYGTNRKSPEEAKTLTGSWNVVQEKVGMRRLVLRPWRSLRTDVKYITSLGKSLPEKKMNQETSQGPSQPCPLSYCDMMGYKLEKNADVLVARWIKHWSSYQQRCWTHPCLKALQENLPSLLTMCLVHFFFGEECTGLCHLAGSWCPTTFLALHLCNMTVNLQNRNIPVNIHLLLTPPCIFFFPKQLFKLCLSISLSSINLKFTVLRLLLFMVLLQYAAPSSQSYFWN